LTDISHTNQLAVAYEEWLEIFRASGRQPPTNLVGRGGGDDLLLRHRDCAVLNWYMRLLDQRSTTSYFYQTVRGVFVEGAPVYDGAGIYTKTHVQISVRDSRCILGYFLPSFFFEGGVEEDDND
jgi:hypothetical protein